MPIREGRGLDALVRGADAPGRGGIGGGAAGLHQSWAGNPWTGLGGGSVRVFWARGVLDPWAQTFIRATNVGLSTKIRLYVSGDPTLDSGNEV